jgi:hypothetical protein
MLADSCNHLGQKRPNHHASRTGRNDYDENTGQLEILNQVAAKSIRLPIEISAYTNQADSWANDSID